MENLLPPKEWFIDGIKEEIKEHDEKIKFFEENKMEIHKQTELLYKDNLMKWLIKLGGDLHDSEN